MSLTEGTSILFVRLDKGEPEVLLLLRDDRDDIPYPNCWDIPGGHVEQGETPEECIAREMMEEIGVDIGLPQLFRRYGMNDRIEYTYWQHSTFALSEVRLNEGQALRWFTENGIKALHQKDIAFGFREVLMDFFKERPFS